MSLQAIKYKNGNLEILDQLLLPVQSKYVSVKNVEDGWKTINKMQVSSLYRILIVFYILTFLNLTIFDLLINLQFFFILTETCNTFSYIIFY